MTYRIKPEFYDLWGATWETSLVTDEDIQGFSQEWETPIQELMEQVDKHDPEKEDDFTDAIFNYLSDNYDEYDLDPEHVADQYKVEDICLGVKAHASIQFANDDHWYTVTRYGNDIRIDY